MGPLLEMLPFTHNMKRLIFISFVWLSICSALSATQSIYGTLTISTNPSDGDTIAVNPGTGNVTRTFKDTVSDPPNQIKIGSDIESTVINLHAHYSTYRIANIISSRASASTFRFYAGSGASLTITVGAWGSVAYVSSTLSGKATTHLVVDNLSSLQSLDPTVTQSATIRFLTTLNDGGSGRFYSTDDSLTDNGGTVLESSHTSGWFWVREDMNFSRPEFWGAKGDRVADDLSAIQSAVDLGGHVRFSARKSYRITDNIEFTTSETHLFFEEGSEIYVDSNSIGILCDTLLTNISILNARIIVDGTNGRSNAGLVQMNKVENFFVSRVMAIADNASMDEAGIGMNGFNTSQGASGIFSDCIAIGTTKSGYHISTGSDFVTLRNCIATNNFTTNTGTYGRTPGFDTSGSFITFDGCKAYNNTGPGFLISADGPPETNSCADNVLIKNCEVWNPGVAAWSTEGWGLAVRSAYDEWPTNIVVNGLRVYNAYNAVLKLEKGEDFDISNVQGYNVPYLGVVGDDDTRKVRLTNIFLSGDPDATNTTRGFVSDGGTNYVINGFVIRDFDRGFEHITGPAMNDISISGFKYDNVTTPFLFNSTHQITNGHWSLRGPWTTPNASTHGAAPDGSVWYNTTAGAATALYVKVNGTWTAK